MLQGEILSPGDQGGLNNAPALSGNADISIEDLTDPQKAAIILVSMDPGFAAPIVEKLTDAHMQRFVKALEELREVPRPKMLAVIAAFIVELNSRQNLFRAGPGKAMDIARGVLDEDRLTRLANQDPSLKPTKVTPKQGVWAELDKRSPKSICDFITKQKTEVAAFILSKLSNEVVSDILVELPEAQAVAYLKELSEDGEVAIFVQKAVEKFVLTEFLEAEEAEVQSESVAYVADLISSLDRERRERILEDIGKQDAMRAKSIRDEMLTFDDLPDRLPVTAIPIVFKEFDRISLLEMLKAAENGSQPVIDFLLGNISQRMAEQIKEEVSELSPMKDKAAAKATASFMAFLGNLEKEERLTFIPKADEALSDGL
jgi:flagellar motor switch protein FliG